MVYIRRKARLPCIRGFLDVCVPSTLAVQEVEQLYQLGQNAYGMPWARHGTSEGFSGPRAIVRDNGANLVKIGRIGRKEV